MFQFQLKIHICRHVYFFFKFAAAMKKYNGQSMAESSRYKDYLPSISKEGREAIYSRINTLIVDNGIYCDKGNYGHLCNIFTAMAIYSWLQESGKSKDEAFEIVSTEMWNYVEKGAVKIRKILKPGMLKLMGKIVPLGFSKGSGYGWEYAWHESTKDTLRFECLKCIYAPIFNKYDMSELGPMFCHADDINYGHLQGIKFTRLHTLSKDGQPCDFLFTREG